MAHHLADLPGGGVLMSRRTLFGFVLAAGVVVPLVVGAGAACADEDAGGEEEEYEIPDDIGSVPWW